ncbi:MAG: hypothetical protein PHN75_05080 [Syntrophales bacterium]|nr:hypothetical protein [Syntrophales bacterium]
MKGFVLLYGQYIRFSGEIFQIIWENSKASVSQSVRPSELRGHMQIIFCQIIFFALRRMQAGWPFFTELLDRLRRILNETRTDEYQSPFLPISFVPSISARAE